MNKGIIKLFSLGLLGLLAGCNSASPISNKEINIYKKQPISNFIEQRYGSRGLALIGIKCEGAFDAFLGELRSSTSIALKEQIASSESNHYREDELCLSVYSKKYNAVLAYMQQPSVVHTNFLKLCQANAGRFIKDLSLTQASYIQDFINVNGLQKNTNPNYYGAFNCLDPNIANESMWSVVIFPMPLRQLETRSNVYNDLLIFDNNSPFYIQAINESIPSHVRLLKQALNEKRQENIKQHTQDFLQKLPFSSLTDQAFNKLIKDARKSLKLCSDNKIKMPSYLTRSEFIDLGAFNITKNNDSIELMDLPVTEKGVATTYATDDNEINRNVKMQQFIDYYTEYRQWHYLFPATSFDVTDDLNSVQIGPFSVEKTPAVIIAYSKRYCSYVAN